MSPYCSVYFVISLQFANLTIYQKGAYYSGINLPLEIKIVGGNQK